jgi:hypothetical protein
MVHVPEDALGIYPPKVLAFGVHVQDVSADEWMVPVFPAKLHVTLCVNELDALGRLMVSVFPIVILLAESVGVVALGIVVSV